VYTEHLEAAFNARGRDKQGVLAPLAPRAKLLLLNFAHHACRTCGLAWPGIPRLAQRSSMGVNAVRELVQVLVKEGHLEVYSHSKGGRGMTTIYRVLPGVVATQEAPCEQCWENLRLAPNRRGAAPAPRQAEIPIEAAASTPHVNGTNGKPSPRGAGIEIEASAETLTPGARVNAKPSPREDGLERAVNPTPGARVSALPSGFHRKTLPPGVRRTVKKDEQSTRAGAREAVAAPPGSEPPHPGTPALNFAEKLQRQIPGYTPSPQLHAIATGLSNAATTAERGKAQPSGQARVPLAAAAAR
jgi:hypothetical protein